MSFTISMEKNVVFLFLGILFLSLVFISAFNFPSQGTGVSVTTYSGNLTNFTELQDTPSSYSGHGDECVVVNSGATGLSFTSCSVAGNPFGFYNITDFDYNDYPTLATLLDFNYYNDSTNFGTQGSVLFLDSNGTIIEDNSNLFWDDTNNRLGIGTTGPNYPLQVNGTSGGITASFEGNITAEDYLYHSPFTPNNYTKEQALNDVIKIGGVNGQINHSSVPSFVQSEIQVPIYEKETYEDIEQICNYESSITNNGKYEYKCINVTTIKERNKQTCKIEDVESYEEINGKGIYNKVVVKKEVCIENPPINYETQEQTSIGKLIGVIIKSIQGIIDRTDKLEEENQILRTELCQKDMSYSWCK